MPNPPKQKAPEAPELSPKMFIVPLIMITSKVLKLDFAPYVFELRVGFALAVVISILAQFGVMAIASKKNDATEVTVKAKNLQGKMETNTYTTAAYDKMEALKDVRQGLITVCMVSFIHYKWGNPMPLLFQCIMLPMGLMDKPLVKIHLLGAQPVGKLARPFAAPPNPLEQMLGGDDAADEKAVARKQD